MAASGALSLVEHRVTFPDEHELIEIRELVEEEAEEIASAADLIAYTAASHRFRRLEDLAQLAASRIGVVEARDQPTEQELDSCRAVVRALVLAHEAFIADALGLLDNDGGDKNGAAARSALEAQATSQTWAVLAKLDGPGVQLASDRAHNLGILDENSDFTPLSPLVDEAFRECEEAFMRVLVTIGGEVLTAAQLLRRLHAECPQGVPALIDIEQLTDDPRATSFTPPSDLPIHLIPEALRLVRTAERLLDETADQSDLARVEWDERELVAADRDQAATDRDDAARVSNAGDDPTHEPVEVQELEFVDLSGLIRAAVELNDTLEGAWSGALDRALTEEGIQRQLAAVRAAIAGFQQRSRDEDILLREFPPGPEVIAQLEANPAEARERLAYAQLANFVQVLDRLDALTRPTRVQVKLDSRGQTELARFWESGGFSRLRASLDQLRHLLEEPPPSEESGYPVEADRRFRLSRAAYFAGDPEACLFHAACGLAWRLGKPVSDVEESLASDARRTAASAGLRALQAQLRGEATLALSTLTAPVLADAAVDLVMPHATGQGLGADELYELLAKEVPHIRLDGDD